MSFIMVSYADDPRAIYREIYAQITSAESKASAGQADVASKEFQEVLFHLENFQKQFPDWEPEIVKFRIQYTRNQIKQLQKGSAPEPAPVAQQPPPAPQPQPAVAAVPPPPPLPAPAPVTVQYPAPAPVTQALAPTLPPEPAPIAQNPVPPDAPQPVARPTKILPLPEPEKITPPAPEPIAEAPLPSSEPPRQMASLPPPDPQPIPSTPPPMPAPAQQSAPAPVPQALPLNTTSNLVLSQPAITPSPLTSLSTANLQSMAREVEARVTRLERENKALRASLAEAQSRADVSSSYVKVLTRENEFLQDKLNRELRKLEELRQILSSEFAEHSSRWNALQMRVKELINNPDISAPQTLIVPPADQPTYTLPAPTPAEAAPAPKNIQQSQQPSQSSSPSEHEKSVYTAPLLFEVTLSTID